METVTPERSNWRDEAISKRHRLWGVACKATDLDFILFEFTQIKSKQIIIPCALIEYKHEFARAQRLRNLQFRALRALGNRARLPTFAARYKSDFSNFHVVPVNNHAKELLPNPTNMSEIQYVAFLYKLRGLPLIPQDVIDVINANDNR